MICFGNCATGTALLKRKRAPFRASVSTLTFTQDFVLGYHSAAFQAGAGLKW